MKNFTSEMIEKARAAKSADELLALAKENNVEMTEESAKAYFEQLHPASGELSDDELDNVAGGGCHASDGRLVTTVANDCQYWHCKKCGSNSSSAYATHGCKYTGEVCLMACNECQYISYEKGLWLCNHPKNRK